MEGATVIQAKNQNKKEEVGVQGIQHATEQLFNSSQNIRFLSISQLSVNKKEESENKCTTFQNLNFFLITEYSTDTKRHKIIFLCHSTKAGWLLQAWNPSHKKAYYSTDNLQGPFCQLAL